MGIVEFLEARIAEDEAVAKAEVDLISATYGKVPGEFEIHYGWARHTEHVENGAQGASFAPGAPEPARVLREVAAKRAIIEAADEASDLDMSVDNDRRVGCRDMTEEPYLGDVILRALAAPYADHPDFNEEWRP